MELEKASKTVRGNSGIEQVLKLFGRLAPEVELARGKGSAVKVDDSFSQAS